MEKILPLILMGLLFAANINIPNYNYGTLEVKWDIKLIDNNYKIKFILEGDSNAVSAVDKIIIYNVEKNNEEVVKVISNPFEVELEPGNYDIRFLDKNNFTLGSVPLHLKKINAMNVREDLLIYILAGLALLLFLRL
jgi:hypothetical protein